MLLCDILYYIIILSSVSSKKEYKFDNGAMHGKTTTPK